MGVFRQDCFHHGVAVVVVVVELQPLPCLHQQGHFDNHPPILCASSPGLAEELEGFLFFRQTASFANFHHFAVIDCPTNLKTEEEEQQRDSIGICIVTAAYFRHFETFEAVAGEIAPNYHFEEEVNIAFQRAVGREQDPSKRSRKKTPI